MLLLGLLLFAASGAFAGLLIADNLGGGPEVGVTVLGNHIATVNTLGAFLAGLALALLFCAGLALMGAGVRWHRRVRRAAARDNTQVVADRTADTRITERPITDDALTERQPDTDDPGITEGRPAAERPRSHPRHRFGH
ncbi:hypothetical protein [Streptomyces sp. TLI_171]|uniref:hypothetical protein n=1 Tax=Streptomyces sp. TLI_171 TaxID=1938859 RepID=UPI000C19C554|nr:hypothetical protein [Streptomyces sp. TLI_171]RKE17484.1 hypothetical protein BX266_0742 [Streptomyces sp. TLI_171]